MGSFEQVVTDEALAVLFEELETGSIIDLRHTDCTLDDGAENTLHLTFASLPWLCVEAILRGL
jgi:hypothetical protein